MRRKILSVLGIGACGLAFQVLGCQSQQIADIVAASVKNTAVDVSTFVVESLVDEALGLDN